MDPVSAPLRVLQVVLRLDPGGTERLVIDLAKRLHAEIPTAVCCLDDAGAWATELTDRGITVTALHRRPGFHPGLGRRVLGAVKHHRATVIHAHHYSPYVYSCLARLGRPATRVVFTEHGRLSDAAPSAKRRFGNRLFRKFSSDVFAVSEDVKQHLVGEGFAPDAVGVIYNGIDVGPLPSPAARSDARRRLGVSDEVFVIGTIARLDPVKDLGTLIEAAALLALNVDAMVVVVGDGAERGTLEALAGRLDIAPRIRFLGHRDDAREWLAGCDVYVNCSISEGVSLTILEAMAAGLPVIATRVGGTPEVVDESCGRLVPARDAKALASALSDLAREDARRHTLGTAARGRVEARFTLERMVGAYRDVYAGAH